MWKAAIVEHIAHDSTLVSEGLNSVESELAKHKRKKVAEVSEGLNSVEREYMQRF